jgi:hypothetical protein
VASCGYSNEGSEEDSDKLHGCGLFVLSEGGDGGWSLKF